MHFRLKTKTKTKSKIAAKINTAANPAQMWLQSGPDAVYVYRSRALCVCLFVCVFVCVRSRPKVFYVYHNRAELRPEVCVCVCVCVCVARVCLYISTLSHGGALVLALSHTRT